MEIREKYRSTMYKNYIEHFGSLGIRFNTGAKYRDKNNFDRLFISHHISEVTHKFTKSECDVVKTHVVLLLFPHCVCIYIYFLMVLLNLLYLSLRLSLWFSFVFYFLLYSAYIGPIHWLLIVNSRSDYGMLSIILFFWLVC